MEITNTNTTTIINYCIFSCFVFYFMLYESYGSRDDDMIAMNKYLSYTDNPLLKRVISGIIIYQLCTVSELKAP